MPDDEVERELRNWALWYSSGGWMAMRSSGSISPIYAPEGQRYREAAVPILAGAAWDVDTIVGGLPAEQKEALHAWYLALDPAGRRIPSVMTVRQVARRLGCAESTYRRRVEDARKRVGDELAAKRRRMEQARLIARA